MKNPKMIVAMVAVVAVLGIGASTLYQKSSKSDAMMKKDAQNSKMEDKSSEASEGVKEQVMEKKQGETMEKEDDKMGSKVMGSRYVEYSKEALEKAASARRVLFFYASWCPTCRPADTSFKTNEGKIPGDVTIIRVNYNDPDTDQEEKELAKKYGITYQHTYVQIDATGKEVAKWNGGQINELLTNIK